MHAEGRMEPLCENVCALRRQMEAWRLKDSCGQPSSTGLMLDEGLKGAAERALRDTVHDNDADCARMKGASVLRVEQTCNPLVWKDYERSKERMKQAGRDIARIVPGVPEALLTAFPWIAQHLDSSINERLVFHGTTRDNLPAILAGGFNERFARTGLYGDGVYFAEKSCKSAQYCKDVGERCIIIARVVLGCASIARCPARGERKAPFIDPQRPALGMHDSVVAHPGIPIGPGKEQVHREFIIFNGTQAYPEFVIYFTV